MGSGDILIVGGIALLAGAWLLYPDMFAGIIPSIPGASGGGEFIDPGTVTPSGDFIVEDTPNPTGDCKSQFNGKCKGECATDKYSASCQQCLAVCGGGQGQPPGQCYSVGKDKSVKCGSTSNTCVTVGSQLQCKCGSNVKGNKITNDRPFNMGGNRTCNDCVTYCKTGAAPKILNNTPTTTPKPTTGGGSTCPTSTQPKRHSDNCVQIKCAGASSSFRWDSVNKSEYGTSCNNARDNWMKKYAAPNKTTSTLCKCGTGTAKHVIGSCSACKSACSRTCGNCSPQCLGTRTNVGYYFEDAAESYFDDATRFSNMAFAI